MQVVALQIATMLDAEAAGHCGFVPTSAITPFPLHELACASVFSVTRTTTGELLYSVESFCRNSMSERSIIGSLEEAVEHAQVVLSFGGRRFDLPVLLTRAMLHEVHVPHLADMQNGKSPGRHCDLFEQVKQDADAVSLAQLCAPFSIPVAGASASILEYPTTGTDWAALEVRCTTNAVACWLAAQFCNKVQAPGSARASWRDLARWIGANAADYPALVPFADVPALT